MVLRARAAQPLRPGITVKQVLMGQIPLDDGRLVTEASITDIHNAYRELTRRVNAVRKKKYRGMTYHSFITMFKFAVLMGLVEFVRSEPMNFPPPNGNLYTIETGPRGGKRVVVSTRKIFKLTELGKADELAWTNLKRAWQENWELPQAAPLVSVPLPILPIDITIPTSLPEEFKPIEWNPAPSAERLKNLYGHIRLMKAFGMENPEVAAEAERLATLISDWSIEYMERVEKARDEARKQRFTKMAGIIDKLSNAFYEEDLESAERLAKELTEI